MLKKLAKMFIPSSKKLGRMAAEKIKKTINESEKDQLIAKYSGLISNTIDTQKWLTEVLKDGKIDEIEESEIAEKLEVIFEKVKELI